MHPDDLHLQRLADGEPPPPDALEAARVATHVEACPACAGRVAELRDADAGVASLLATLDHPVPSVDVASLVDGGEVRVGGASPERRSGERPRGDFRGGERRPRHQRPAPDRRRSGRRPWRARAAAVALLLVTAGAAWAASGLPLPAWLRPGPAAQAPRAVPSPASGSEGGARAGAGGVAVDPGGSLVVDFAAPEAGGEVLVRLTDGAEVTVRASVAGVRYASSPDRLLVENPDPASPVTYRVAIPRGAPRVEVRVAGRRVLLVESGRLEGGEAAADGGRRIPLDPRIPPDPPGS